MLYALGYQAIRQVADHYIALAGGTTWITNTSGPMRLGLRLAILAAWSIVTVEHMGITFL